MSKFYCGIGSRQTPNNILELMTSIATQLKSQNWILRSGHAKGADRAFELGAKENSEIYIPWLGFGTKPYKEDKGMPILGKTIIDRNQWLKNYQHLLDIGIRSRRDVESVQLLHGRNYAQIFGLPNDKPSAFVIFYAEEIERKVQGGTASAVELAKREKIPTFNLWNETQKNLLIEWLKKQNQVS